MTEPRHLSEIEIAASLVPGARRPACPVPGCVSCAAKLDEAHCAGHEFRERVLPRTLPAVLSQGTRLPGRRPAAAWMRWLVAPVAAAAMVVIAVAVWPRHPINAPGGVLSAKGGATARDQLEIFVRRDGAVRPLALEEEVQPGDALRFVVEPRGARFALVVSIDAAERVNTYVPYDGTASVALPDQAQVALDGSVILDDVLGAERVWVVLSSEPVTVDRIRPQLLLLAAAGRAAVIAADARALTPDLPGVTAVTRVLHKVRRAESPTAQ